MPSRVFWFCAATKDTLVCTSKIVAANKTRGGRSLLSINRLSSKMEIGRSTAVGPFFNSVLERRQCLVRRHAAANGYCPGKHVSLDSYDWATTITGDRSRWKSARWEKQ